MENTAPRPRRAADSAGRGAWANASGRAMLALLLGALAACDGRSQPLEAAGGPGFSAAVRQGRLPGADGVQLSYRVVGGGPDTVVVVSGGPGILSMSYLADDWGPLGSGRTVIYYDQRAAGWSDLPDTTALGVDRFVADLEALRLHFGLRKLTLVGHSWGAMLAALYAAAHPDRAERLVLLNPGPVSFREQDAFVANLLARATPHDLEVNAELKEAMASGPAPVESCEALFSHWFRLYVADTASVDRLRGRWCDMPEPTARRAWDTHARTTGSMGARWDFGPTLGAVRAHTLVVHGERDLLTAENASAWAAAIPGAGLVVLPGVGHFPWLERRGDFMRLMHRHLGPANR